MIIKDLIKEINQGKNLERNLPNYLNELMTLQNNSANYSMTFHYYTFLEMLMEHDYTDIEEFEEQVQLIKDCTDVYCKEDSSVEQMNLCVKALDELRVKVIAKMKVLTAYTDVFQIYEYIINRIEAKYSTIRYTAEDEEFASRIMQYIFADQDSATVNAKIQEVVGQLPVRITKSKFLELLKNSLSIYQGCDKSAVDTFLYMVKTGAMLDRPEGYDTEYPVLVEYKRKFESVDYKNLTQDEFEQLIHTLHKAVEFIEHVARAYYTMQEVINDLYALLLTKPYANMPGTIDTFSSDVSICSSIISKLTQINTKENDEIPEDVTIQLNPFVGKPERVVELRSVAESIFYDVTINHSSLLESMMLTANVNCIECVMKLQSNSIFVELDREAIHGEADEIYMKRIEKELMREFDEILTASSQVVSRAIMGNVLCKLPVFFHNQNEISEYVYNSLSCCKDEAEKSACIQLIQEFIG